jgi:copper chaperone
MKNVNFEVAGMSCGHCVHAVREAAASVDGVTVESIRIGAVAVALDESKATIGQVVDAIADAGYDATEVAAA